MSTRELNKIVSLKPEPQTTPNRPRSSADRARVSGGLPRHRDPP
jgi:hypothetical protein